MSLRRQVRRMMRIILLFASPDTWEPRSLPGVLRQRGRQKIMYRLLGIAMLVVAGLILARSPAVANWLGKPIGWQWFWDSFRGTGGAGNTVYKGYKGYTTVAGWFWLVCVEAILIGLGVHFVLTNAW